LRHTSAYFSECVLRAEPYSTVLERLHRSLLLTTEAVVSHMSHRDAQPARSAGGGFGGFLLLLGGGGFHYGRRRRV